MVGAGRRPDRDAGDPRRRASPSHRTVDTGSWLGAGLAGPGLRQGDARGGAGLRVRRPGCAGRDSEAFLDNAASNAVSRSLGYEEDGSRCARPAGRLARDAAVPDDRRGLAFAAPAADRDRGTGRVPGAVRGVGWPARICDEREGGMAIAQRMRQPVPPPILRHRGGRARAGRRRAHVQLDQLGIDPRDRPIQPVPRRCRRGTCPGHPDRDDPRGQRTAWRLRGHGPEHPDRRLRGHRGGGRAGSCRGAAVHGAAGTGHQLDRAGADRGAAVRPVARARARHGRRDAAVASRRCAEPRRSSPRTGRGVSSGAHLGRRTRPVSGPGSWTGPSRRRPSAPTFAAREWKRLRSSSFRTGRGALGLPSGTAFTSDDGHASKHAWT